ncbi:MAG: hypothetical protein RL071_4802 [Pseudomonadota bacterium]
MTTRPRRRQRAFSLELGPMGLSLLMLMLVFLFGIVGYMQIEGWSAFDALWMVVITLTTIGYGEPIPLSVPGRIFTMGLVLGGVTIATYALSAVTQALLEGDLQSYLHQRRQERLMNKMKDHYIIIGYGRLGRVVAQELMETTGPICVIERDPKRCEELRRRDIPVIEGDGADDEHLRAAGIDRCKGVAITTAPAAEAIFATLSVRQLRADVPILTRVESDEEGVKARRAGATKVVSPLIMGGWRMAHGLARPNAASFLDLATLAEAENVMLDELLVEPGTTRSGATVASLAVGSHHGVLIVAIRKRDGGLVTAPGAEAPVAEGDVLIVIGEPAKVRHLAELVGPDALSRRPRAR